MKSDSRVQTFSQRIMRLFTKWNFPTAVFFDLFIGEAFEMRSDFFDRQSIPILACEQLAGLLRRDDQTSLFGSTKKIVLVLNPEKLSIVYSIHEPLSHGHAQGNDYFVSLTSFYLAYHKVQCCIPPSHFSHDLVDMFVHA